jgi:hypothetical protein
VWYFYLIDFKLYIFIQRHWSFYTGVVGGVPRHVVALNLTIVCTIFISNVHYE